MFPLSKLIISASWYEVHGDGVDDFNGDDIFALAACIEGDGDDDDSDYDYAPAAMEGDDDDDDDEIVLPINSVRLEESSMWKDKYSPKFDGKVNRVDRKNELYASRVHQNYYFMAPVFKLIGLSCYSNHMHGDGDDIYGPALNGTAMTTTFPTMTTLQAPAACTEWEGDDYDESTTILTMILHQQHDLMLIIVVHGC
ncbi:hypothetical protein L3X38_040231 [Prunus dulcis]|uniref:Uncharacterized protein n=1 Tax=Prunus dulcis TaxID=3755 RepID=A0AAD4V921_PRUDU|nr:hypothetical protein L3X38_040231 [Prunus dulcis]